MGLQQTNNLHTHARLHKKYLAQVPTTHPQKCRICTIQSGPKKYGANVQLAKEEDGTPELSASAIELLQKNIVSLLFYGIAVYITLLVSLITLAYAQYHGL